MSAETPMKVVLCWHMHQPQYKDLISGEFQLPWTYLHAIKDYVDMVAHLEALPHARAVVNFAPILLEQIDEYARQVKGFLEDSVAIHDPLLAALDMPAHPVDPEHRIWLIKSCLRANEERLVNAYPDYRELVDMAAWFMEKPHAMRYVAGQYLADLVVWYHLVGLGETVRRTDRRVKDLLEKGNGYTLQDRRTLLEVVGEQLNSIVGRYKALAEKGQVELSVTPYAHPIVPLLLELQSAKEAMPEVHMPVSEAYPGGRERALWHMGRGLEVFENHFGFRPRGCWPSEGSVSTATLKLLEEVGFDWVASGETVVRNSLERSGQNGDAQGEQPVYRRYQLEGLQISAFFRDDGLSDLIGFTYADWHADDAAANLLHHLENIADASDDENRVVSIILDGENAWEHYPHNGYYFLKGLYEGLVEHPKLELTTFSACLDAPLEPRRLPSLVAGSWVYGTFSTWIGDEGKNRGWDMLVDAKRAYDENLAAGKLTGRTLSVADVQLAVCEGSDWFWWFGDYNPAETVSDFERLYRLHLANFYQLIGREPPEYLSHTFTHGRGQPRKGGVMRTGREGA